MKTKYLVVDTSAFIGNTPLHELGENVVTVQEVINEVRNKRQLRRLAFLTYDLEVKDVFSESIAHVTEFSKKTGDFPSLSATDIKVLALTYQLEKQYVGTDHIRTAPLVKRSINYTNKPALALTDIAGFYVPKKGRHSKEAKNKENNAISGNIDNDERSVETHLKKLSLSISGCDNQQVAHESDGDFYNAVSDLSDAFDSSEDEKWTDCVQTESDLVIDTEESILTLVENSDNENDSIYGSDTSDEGHDTDDDGCWITPINIASIKRKLNPGMFEDKPAVVGCLTMDFAMQNVLKQMGLNVIALDGRIIKEMRTFILRCYACFKTTSLMNKVFCPHCGNKTLKRVSVSLDDNGNQVIHINVKKLLSAKGKRFSLPAFKGGKHAVNPRLVEDAQRPHQRMSKLARTKTDALHPDYTAGISPFVTRDIYSKASRYGVPFKYWMQKNPNEPKRRPKK